MRGTRAQSLPEPGDTLVGKYRIVRKLGEGGMGVVYQAEHLRLNQPVAIKMLRSEVKELDEIVTRFEREARAAARLRGPHVANVTDVDTLDDGTPFMVMEYLHGTDLGEELDARGQLPVAEAVNYLLQTCAAMAEAHQCRIVHRDLKPSNLFLVGTGSRRTLKVLDFGISKMHVDGDHGVTMTQLNLGTPLYMSPEQIRSAKYVDHRTDIWSLGVILYQLLTGVPPFVGASATAVAAAITADTPRPLGAFRPDVPEQLEAVLMKALQKHPTERYATAEEFARALLPFAGDLSSWTPPPRHSMESGDIKLFVPDETAMGEAATVAGESLHPGERTAPGWAKSTDRTALRRGPIVTGLLVGATLSVAGYWLLGRGGDSAPEAVPATADQAAVSQPATAQAGLDPVVAETMATAPVAEPPASVPVPAPTTVASTPAPPATTVEKPALRRPKLPTSKRRAVAAPIERAPEAPRPPTATQRPVLADNPSHL